MNQIQSIKTIFCVGFLIVSIFGNAQQYRLTMEAAPDSIEFGQTATIIYNLQGISPSVKDTIIIDYSKIRNEFYDEKNGTFEQYADVFVGFDNTNIDQFYNSSDKKLLIPVASLPQGQAIQWRAIIKFLSYGSFAVGNIVSFENNSPEGVNNAQGMRVGVARVIVSLPKGLSQTPDTDVNDIKPIVEVYLSFWQKYGSYIKWLGLLALLAAIAYKYGKKLLPKRPEVEIVEEEIIPPQAHEIALEQLNQLNKSKPWLSGQELKEYHTTFTSIMRTYVQDRYEISAMEMTTSEIIEKLHALKVNNTSLDDLSNMLEISDLVKFAKANVTSDINQEYLDKALTFVIKTKQML